MFKKLFGPFPDEPLLYGFDKIVDLYNKFDLKLKRNNALIDANTASNSTAKAVEFDGAANENINDVINETETTTEIVVTSTQRCFSKNTILQKSETSSYSSKICTNQDNTQVSCKIKKVDEVTEIHEHNSTPRPTVKRSSSMECNYTLSKVDVTKRRSPFGRKVCPEKVISCTSSSTRRYKTTKVNVLDSHYERKLFVSDGKKRIESIMKREKKQQSVHSVPIGNGSEPSSKTLNEFTGQRKVNKMEWADTRVRICDDDSEIYEILNKDGSMKKIIVIAPNKTTVAYDPLKRKLM